MNNNNLAPLWGEKNLNGKTILTSSYSPSIGEIVDIGGIKAEVCNVFINEGKMYISYRLGNEILTKEYKSNLILG